MHTADTVIIISNGRVAAGESQPELHSAPNAESNVDVLAITIKLAELEPYIETNYHDNESTFQVFEADKALEDGFEREIVSLAKEMIEYQNSVMQTLKRENNVSCIQNPRINDYPRLVVCQTLSDG